jgi:hypothetical protein
MTYTILIYETQDDFGARTDGKRKDAYWSAYRAYTLALKEAGVMVGGGALQPAAVATTVRQRGQRRGRGQAEPLDVSDARRTAELAARASYGRLLAYLAARSRDVAAAEDALGDAFAAALETWPRASEIVDAYHPTGPFELTSCACSGDPARRETPTRGPSDSAKIRRSASS